MIDLARARGIAVLNAAPYAGGVLAKGSSEYPRYVYQEASDAALDPIRRIEAICARHGVPPGAAALQFSMRDPRVDVDDLRRDETRAGQADARMGALSDPRRGLGGIEGGALFDR